MSLDRLEQLTLSLLEIESPSGKEDALRSHLHTLIKSQKFAEKFDEIQDNNTLIYIDKRRQSKRIMLCAHIDTVPGKLSISSDDKTIFGRGAVDVKGGIAILLKLMEEGVETVTDFVFYDNEEGLYENNGLGRCFQQGIMPQSTAAIVIEPTDLTIELGTHSSLTLDLIFSCKGGHSASLNRSENPIFKAFLSIDNIQRFYAYRSDKIDSFDYFYSVEPTKITGGIANNVIPKECKTVLNFRFPPNIKVSDFLEELKSRFIFNPKIEILDYSPGSPPQTENEWISNLIKNSRGNVKTMRAWSDAARLYLFNVPAITFGPGDIKLAHSSEEKLTIKDLYEAYNILLELLNKKLI